VRPCCLARGGGLSPAAPAGPAERGGRGVRAHGAARAVIARPDACRAARSCAGPHAGDAHQGLQPGARCAGGAGTAARAHHSLPGARGRAGLCKGPAADAAFLCATPLPQPSLSSLGGLRIRTHTQGPTRLITHCTRCCCCSCRHPPWWCSTALGGAGAPLSRST